MNIAICGLQPEQVRIVQQEFPKHSLRFLDLDHQRGPAIKNAAKGCDKVILMTGGAGLVSHATQDQVPPSKRLIVRGGIQKLRAELQKLPTPVRDVTPARSSMPTLPASLSKPTGKVMKQGRWKGSEVVDWEPLLTGKVGDTVRINRPSNLTLKDFERRIDVTRSYRKTHNGIVTERPQFVDGGALLTITAIQEPKPYKKGKAGATQAVATPETTAPQPAAPPEQETAAMQVHVEVQRPVAVANGTVLATGRESAFWQSVFVETMKQWPGAPIDTIAARADEALRAYNARASVTAGDRH